VSDAASGASPERIWTPWRMRYVGGEAHVDGCLFCRRRAERDDVASLILHRGERAFIIMNLFPYNTGHVMLVPNEHVPTPAETSPETLAALGEWHGPVLRALGRALGCDGFNIGVNVGAAAGAGIAEHLHQHVVPRWVGDSNFMPVLAATKVMPELIPVTYAKLRAELAREFGGAADIPIVILDHDGSHACLEPDGALPIATAADDEPLWKAAVRAAQDRTGRPVELIGWAGASAADRPERALALRVVEPSVSEDSGECRWTPLAEATGPAADAARRGAALVTST
jgi:ATP adenylyltransferase